MNHYEERLDRDTRALRDRIAALGGTLDTALANAVRAFLLRDRNLAAETILGDQPVNRATRNLDRLCHAFVVRHLPSAGHLRYISAVLRLSVALERVGDYAVSISREAVQSSSPVPPTVARDIEMMAEQGRAILRQALKAFHDQSPELARGTMGMETQSDTVYRKVYSDLLAEAEGRVLPVRDAFAHLVILGRLERISDQAKNICEETIFAVTGETKRPRAFRILFLDSGNFGPGVLAEAVALKAFPQGAAYESAGWDPAPAHDPRLLAFLDSRGMRSPSGPPRRIGSAHEDLRSVDVVVGLEQGAREKAVRLPYGTVFLDWHAEVSDWDAASQERLEDSYRRLASRIRGLMETLCGDAPA